MKQEKLNQLQSLLVSEQVTILNFFKSRFPLFHNSNFFFRDFQFTINAFFELKKIFIGYTECEQLTNYFLENLEKQNMAVKVSINGWKLQNPEYKTGAGVAEAVAAQTA